MRIKPARRDGTTTEMRRHPRYTVGGRIQCEMAVQDIPVSLLNVSRSGFLVQGPMQCRIGDIQQFRFNVEFEGHFIFVLRARVIHCAARVVDGTTAYLTGLEFLDVTSPVYQRAIDHLVRALSPSPVRPPLRRTIQDQK